MGRGNYRKRDTLTTKFREMGKKITFFNGIYNNLKRQWAGGTNDKKTLIDADKSYKIQNNNKVSPHEEAWLVLKDKSSTSHGEEDRKKEEKSGSSFG